MEGGWNLSEYVKSSLASQTGWLGKKKTSGGGGGVRGGCIGQRQRESDCWKQLLLYDGNLSKAGWETQKGDYSLVGWAFWSLDYILCWMNTTFWCLPQTECFHLKAWWWKHHYLESLFRNKTCNISGKEYQQILKDNWIQCIKEVTQTTKRIK